MSVIKVGLLGLGTVGSGVVKTIRSQEKKLTARLGKKVQIVKALVRDVKKERQVEVERDVLTTSFSDVLDSGVDVIVEVMGGVEPTYGYLKEAIARGCHIVTANKELLAKHGRELIHLTNQHGVHLSYEASVGGGIPILSVLRQFLRTNDITAVQGIVNGTTNYILSQMEQNQRTYADVLKEAQELGYAEMDPTSDVEGFDAMYKLYILSQLVFGESQPLASVTREGISQLSLPHIQFAQELGYRLKLLASAERTTRGIQLSVQPTLIELSHPLAAIQDAYNAVQVTGNIVGDLLFTGRGAGELPTASAVVEDLAYLLTQPFVLQPVWQEKEAQTVVQEVASSRCYLHIEAEKGDFYPNQIIEWLEEAGVTVVKLKTEFNHGEALRVGVVAEGVHAEQLLALGNQHGVSAKVFPILDNGGQVGEAEVLEQSIEMVS